jgi:hypothetical protein
MDKVSRHSHQADRQKGKAATKDVKPAWDSNAADAFEAKMDEWEKRNWATWLGDHLSFPFKAKREEDDDDAFFTDVADREPFRLGHKMDVLGLEPDEDVDMGVLMHVMEGQHHGYVPLADLEVIPKADKSYWPVREYVVWYANRM